jgi:hypothetical protein
MGNIEITTHSELLLHIMQLKFEKQNQEIKIKNSAKELIKSISPVTMIKDSLHELSHDKGVRFDIAKVGLNLGTNFLLEKVVGRNRSIKGFLSSIILEKISGAFINKNASSIISTITKLIKPNQ